MIGRADQQPPWLSHAEQTQVVLKLLDMDLIKFDNDRTLKLKSGGLTDIYINLRDARDRPAAIGFLTTLFADPIRRLGLNRFVEVPDSVSCFAGPLSLATDLPYLTIREDAKGGRVSDAKTIGHANEGDRIAIIDDVVTDGRSKVTPIRLCDERGLCNLGLVVLVDRQQGWRQLFAEEDVDVQVWPGMTLDDVRYNLINTVGVMQRCDPQVEANNPIIVALDGLDWDQILPTIDALRTTGCIFKVNDLLFDEGIKHLLPRLSTYGRVMADLKVHDIKNTAGNIAKRLKQCHPSAWAVTMHASAGEEAIKYFVETLAGTPTKVLCVTVLTSINKDTCEEIYVRQPMEAVLKLAAIAHRSGAHGLVCSPEEVQELRRLYPAMTLVTPGIRSAGQSAHEQARVATPSAAIERGANHVVMGRQILKNEEGRTPPEEVARLLKEEIPVAA